MLDLSISGMKVKMDLDDPWLTASRWSSIAVFAFFYYLCEVIIVVLLMRLFMALLSATFPCCNPNDPATST